MTSILVTGSSGFVGRALCDHLEIDGYSVTRAVRSNPATNEILLGNIGPETDWHKALANCEYVVHLAARVHIMHDAAIDPLLKFRSVNTEGTLNLARQAAHYGVRRLVYLSSAKVNGENGTFVETDLPSPQDPYAISKLEAEQGLRELARKTDMDVVILRPPLVYGPGVGANFLRLMHLINRGLPLPFGAVSNRRSLVYLGNLVDAISVCLSHPAAAGKTYFVSDGEEVSTPDLIRRLATALEQNPKLLRIPLGPVKLAGRLIGKSREIERLVGSLTMNCGSIRRELDWTPPYSMQEGIAATARWFRKQ